MTEPFDWARVPRATLRRDRRVQGNIARWMTLHERAGRSISKREDGADVVFEAMRTLSLDQFEAPDLATQMSRLRGFGATGARPWRPSSVREALGVPSIFRAASLIANTTGSLSMRGLRNEVEMDPQDRPRIIVRPDPNRTPRDFYRDSAWNLARLGEAWWYVAKRDTDRNALSLYNVPDPREVSVEADPRDPIRAHITWRGLSTKDGTLKREDMRHLTFLPDDSGLRGVGPLQMCGAAVSVSVEAQEWAANFYAAGGYPNIWIQAAGELGGGSDDAILDGEADNAAYSEAERLKSEWISTAPNTPKVTDEGIKDIKQFDPNPNGAQMLEARDFQNGDAGRMFGIPGSLLDYSTPGSSLTYQNVESEFTKWVRSGLRIGYLEPIEQAMSDLLTRSTVGRFNTEMIEAPDVKTRFEVYELATKVLGLEEGAEYARKREGLVAGDVENAPIPFAPPTTVPRIASTAMRDVRCPKCKRLIIRAAGPVEGFCRHCKAPVQDGTVRLAKPERADRAPDVHVHMPEGMVRVDAPVTVHPPDIHVDAPDIHVDAPVIPSSSMSLTMPDTEARIAAMGSDLVGFTRTVEDLARGQAEANQQNLAAIEELRRDMARPRHKTVQRDKRGLLISIREEVEESA